MEEEDRLKVVDWVDSHRRQRTDGKHCFNHCLHGIASFITMKPALMVPVLNGLGLKGPSSVTIMEYTQRVQILSEFIFELRRLRNYTQSSWYVLYSQKERHNLLTQISRNLKVVLCKDL